MLCINTHNNDFFLKQFGFLLLLDFNLYFITYITGAYNTFHWVSCLFIGLYLSVIQLIVITFHQSKMLEKCRF